MGKVTRYFIGNWKMFGIPTSIKIIDRINQYYLKDKKNNKKYKILIAPPHTLLESFSNKYKNKRVKICAQNCYERDFYGAHTGSVSPYMIKKIGVNYIIIGHSENRMSGETENILKEKISLAIKNNFNIILCIGENKTEKIKKRTIKVLKKQISHVIRKKNFLKKIIIAYEPVWSIGTGKVPSINELTKNIRLIKQFVKKRFKTNKEIKILYGGSVDSKNINEFKSIRELDGFLVGGASKSSKKFIDIIKNFYK